jgi:hypothetical protein
MNANSVCCAAFRDAEKDILTAHNAELDRIVEGMPLYTQKTFASLNPYAYPTENLPYNEGAKNQLEQCQAYIQAQKGS